MDFKYQSLILIILVLFSLTITQLNSQASSENLSAVENRNEEEIQSSEDLLNFQTASISDIQEIQKSPVRKWGVLDPEVTADAALIHSLDDEFPLFYTNTHQPHVLASLTKLITSVVVFEEIGLNKKISITAEAVETRGEAGNLTSGEVYSAKDLVKLMLLTSSNDAAAAIEEHLGGEEEFVNTANHIMDEIGMTETVIYDGSGLNDLNMGTASDFLKLSKYILKNHPRIFTWSINDEMLIQPIKVNDINVQSRTETNINPLVRNKDYLGGKTGTSQMAGQNLVALFDSGDRRMLVILIGSDDRTTEAQKLLNWTQKAYNFE